MMMLKLGFPMAVPSFKMMVLFSSSSNRASACPTLFNSRMEQTSLATNQGSPSLMTVRRAADSKAKTVRFSDSMIFFTVLKCYRFFCVNELAFIFSARLVYFNHALTVEKIPIPVFFSSGKLQLDGERVR